MISGISFSSISASLDLTYFWKIGTNSL
jgi:hypothetical protein